jgi:hypothetical protein
MLLIRQLGFAISVGVALYSSASSVTFAQSVTALPNKPAPAVCSNCGVVTAVNARKTKGRASYVGTIGIPAGSESNSPSTPVGDSGEVKPARPTDTSNTVGNQKIVGATGGTTVGREAEKRMRKKDVFEIVVQMDNGSSRVLVKEIRPAIQPGDKVKVIGEDIFVR